MLRNFYYICTSREDHSSRRKIEAGHREREREDGEAEREIERDTDTEEARLATRVS